MENTKKTTLNLDMFNGVNNFNGIDRSNLIVEGEMDVYVPFVVKQLWFRAVYPKGNVKTQMVGSLEDAIRYKLCVFYAEVYDNDNKMIGSGHGSASTDEESFIEVAERRAAGKALASAGFAWHNGDFSMDMDVAKTHLNLYNSYINNGTLDINDTQVTQMYDDALVTVLPEGYGNDTGKPIAAMDQKHLEDIAKNYAVVNSGVPLVNAKIKFVYMYQQIKQEFDKKSDFTSVTIEGVVEGQTNKEEKPKKTRRGRKTKEALVSEPVADSVEQEKMDFEPVQETEEQESPATVEETEEMQETTLAAEEMQDMPAEPESVANDAVKPVNTSAEDNAVVEQETTSEPFDTSDEQTETLNGSEDDFDAEDLEDVFNLPAQDEEDFDITEDVISAEAFDEGMEDGSYLDSKSEVPSFSEMNGIDMDEEGTDNNNVFEGFAIDEAEDNPFAEDAEFDIEKDLQDEMHLQTVLKSWGYRSVEELNSQEKWLEHLKKVRERCAAVNWNDTATAREFIENIPIYNNFLWKEKAEKDHVILLGDFLNEHKDEVIAAMNNGTFPLVTLKNPVDWYIGNVWDEF